MKQPLIRIYDKNGKEYGDKKVTYISWGQDGWPENIAVAFLSDEDQMPMTDHARTGIYESVNKGLFGEF